jgi:hypothetical protein
MGTCCSQERDGVGQGLGGVSSRHEEQARGRAERRGPGRRRRFAAAAGQGRRTGRAGDVAGRPGGVLAFFPRRTD